MFPVPYTFPRGYLAADWSSTLHRKRDQSSFFFFINFNIFAARAVFVFFAHMFKPWAPTKRNYAASRHLVLSTEGPHICMTGCSNSCAKSGCSVRHAPRHSYWHLTESS